MRKQTYLTLEDRKIIEAMRAEGHSQESIARRLGRPQATISFELKKNVIDGAYCAEKAHEMFISRMANRKKRSFDVKVALSDEEQICHLYKDEKASIRALSRHFKIGAQKINSILEKYNIPRNNPSYRADAQSVFDRIYNLEQQMKILAETFKEFIKTPNG
jgi:IS30 family transposase